jgi:glycosyltransferase involved in cell wall biosynthesis
MHVVHLTASTMFGGPERQMLGLAEALPADARTTFLSFAEHGRCAAFLDAVRARGFDGHALASDFPRVRATIRELTERLVSLSVDVLLSHGYKANILGRIAARRAGIPIVGVSRGWTAENWKVRQYERLDRFHLRFLDHVVAVSDAQLAKVLSAGVPRIRTQVIRNSARLAAFESNTATDAEGLRSIFPIPPKRIVLSAGRLSPEKGFGLLVDAADRVLRTHPDAGFVHFGDGIERPAIEAAIQTRNLTGRFVLAGFTDRLDALMPAADLVVLPSYTEGMPNVLLEAAAAGVASVATRVGGSPEVIADGETGLLVPPGDSAAIAQAIEELLTDDPRRAALGRAARDRMQAQYSFAAQAAAYASLFASLVTVSEPDRCPSLCSNDPLHSAAFATAPCGSGSSSTT